MEYAMILITLMASLNNKPVSEQPKILLVDDREDNLLSIEAILEPAGYQFTRAYSGEQALKILLSEVDFAMILMDVKMPVMNGFETAALIYEREKLRCIPTIFITANNYGDENIFKGYQAGGIDYIFKPINPEVLRAKVAVFIDLYRKNALLIEQEQELSAHIRKLEKEIDDLKVSDERLRNLNGTLERENSNLAAMLVSSQLSIERCDMNQLMKKFLADMDDQVTEKMATVSVEPLPTLEVNPILMRPLFQKLISNALHYSKKNVKPVIKIHSEISASQMAMNSNNKNNNRYCHIFLEDNGAGVDKGNVDNIFGRFELSQKNGDLKRINSDLVLCKKIMEKHDGVISARSATDQGSTFIVSFPVA
jgi:CheY-like chemotaxis protein